MFTSLRNKYKYSIIMEIINVRNALIALSGVFLFVQIFKLLGIDISHFTIYISFLVFLIISTVVLPISNLSLQD